MPSSDEKPIICLHCKRQLALATPTRIVFNGGCYCDEPTPLRCASCGARRYWKPARVIDEHLAIVYTEPMPA